MIDVRICSDQEALQRAAARVVLEQVEARPGLVLGVATGSSPLGLYAQLAQTVAAGEADLSRVRAFALDEYVGLPADDPRSHRPVIRQRGVEPLGIPAASVAVPEGSDADPLPEAVRT